uniref:Uncharacterized protein n=1 Tax=Chenopodium quinoa TaxID=63459 RepID=A0A803MK65_CHEQI
MIFNFLLAVITWLDSRDEMSVWFKMRIKEEKITPGENFSVVVEFLDLRRLQIRMRFSIKRSSFSKNSIEKECAADVGSSGAAADVVSSGAVVAEEKLSEKKQKRIKLVATKGKGKKVEKGVKEKQNVKFEDPDGEDVVDEVQGSKSIVYGTLRNRMSPLSVVNVLKKLSGDQLIVIRAIGFESLEFLKVSQLPL